MELFSVNAEKYAGMGDRYWGSYWISICVLHVTDTELWRPDTCDVMCRQKEDADALSADPCTWTWVTVIHHVWSIRRWTREQFGTDLSPRSCFLCFYLRSKLYKWDSGQPICNKIMLSIFGENRRYVMPNVFGRIDFGSFLSGDENNKKLYWSIRPLG